MPGLPDVPADLVKDARLNDQRSISDIYIITSRAATAHAAYFLNRGEEDPIVQEIVQNAYIKAFDSINKSLQTDDGFSPWFYTILNNKCIDYTRTAEYRNKSQTFYYDQVENEDFRDNFVNSFENDNESFDPKSVSDQEAVREGLMECIRKLPENQRQSVLMYYMEGLKIPEICEELDEKPSTVKSWLSRGRGNIEKMINELRAQNKSFYNVLPIPALAWAFKETVKRTPTIKLSKIASKLVVTVNAKDAFAPKQVLSHNPPTGKAGEFDGSFHEFATDKGASHKNLTANKAHTQSQQTAQPQSQPQPQQSQTWSETTRDTWHEETTSSHTETTNHHEDPVHHEQKAQKPPKPPKPPKPEPTPEPAGPTIETVTMAGTTATAVSSSTGIIVVIVSFLIGFVLIGGIIAYTTFHSDKYQEYSDYDDETAESSNDSSGSSSSYVAGLYTFNEDLTVYNTASKDSPTGKTVFLSGSGGNRIIISAVETNGTSSYGKIDGGYVCINDGTEHLTYSSETPVYAGAYYNSENSGEEFKNACGANYVPVQGLGGMPAENVYFQYCPLCDGTLVWY